LLFPAYQVKIARQVVAETKLIDRIQIIREDVNYLNSTELAARNSIQHKNHYFFLKVISVKLLILISSDQSIHVRTLEK